jgi:hypothetical protein
MTVILNGIKQYERYTIRVNYMPDHAAVESVTIWNEGLTSQELGEVITTLDGEYQPMKFVIVRREP